MVTVVDGRGLCERDRAVLDAIKTALDGDFNCSTKTKSDLDEIEHLGIRGYGRPTLDPSDFDGFDALTKLHIEDSPMLSALPQWAFREVPKLTHLVLSGNGIQGLEDGAFAGLEKLLYLDLGRNALRGMPDGAFSGTIYDKDSNSFVDISMQNLNTLILEDNLISELPRTLFFGLHNLVHFQVSGNQIPALDDWTLFNALDKLETFEASRNRIESITDYLFSPLQSTLERIDLSDNKLSELSGKEFQARRVNDAAPLASLDELWLERNGLSSIASDTFSQLPVLNLLSLHGNDLVESDLSQALFDPLDGLGRLDLSRNPALFAADGEIDPDLFDGLNKIVTPDVYLGGTFVLNLGRTGLRSLGNDPFDGYTGLGTLDLGHNELASLAGDPFGGLSGLGGADGHVSLTGNALTSLPAGVFSDAVELAGVHLGDNELASVPASLFSGLNSLQTVDLSGNSLTGVPASLFTGRTVLTEVDLSDNELASLSAGMFDGLNYLENLDLSGNSLSSLPTDVFRDMPSGQGPIDLAWLDLSGNSLSSLPTDVFDPLDADLTFLGLRDNQISTLHADIFDGLTGLERLDLSCNSFGAMNNAQATAFADRFEDPKDSLRFVDLSGATWTNQTVRNRVKAKVEAKLTGEYHVELHYKGPLGASWGAGGTTCDRSLFFDDTLREIRSSAGRVVYDELNERWDVYVGADVDRVTITPITIHPRHTAHGAGAPDIDEDYTVDQADIDAQYSYHDANNNTRDGIQLNLRDAGRHDVRVDIDYPSGHLLDSSKPVRVHREPPRLRAPCRPGPVRLNTVYSDGDGREGGRPGNLMPGVVRFHGAYREYIVLGWAHATNKHCVDRTDVLREDGQYYTRWRVKSWNGAPSYGLVEGGWRDTGTVIGTAFQYTIQRYGSDGSLQHATTQWIPVLPIYLDLDKSWRDAIRPDGSLIPANDVVYKARIQLGGPKNGETVMMGPEGTQGLYTYQFHRFQYASKMSPDEKSRLGEPISMNAIVYLSPPERLPERGAQYRPPERTFEPSAASIAVENHDTDAAANRFTVWCVQVKRTRSNLTDHQIYDGCAVLDLMSARHITHEGSATSRTQEPAPSSERNSEDDYVAYF